jgi:2-polyprenyl-6-methoxyphenol hydroxylase-like FAD-dependent oxidoreductase
MPDIRIIDFCAFCATAMVRFDWTTAIGAKRCLMKRAAEQILVVGAGLGGLSLALCLKRAGFSVDVVEIEPELRIVGAGITLNGASLRAFATIGVLDEIKRKGHCHDTGKMCDADGKLLFTPRSERFYGTDVPNGAGILRPVLHRILADAAIAAGVPIRFSTTVEALAQSADGVDVAFIAEDSGHRRQYDLVVSADGLASKTRALIFPDAPKPRFTGQGCWRAVLPRPSEIDTSCTFMARYHKAGINPVSQDEMYLYLLQHVPDNRWMPPKEWPALLAAELTEFGGLLSEIREGLGPSSRINYRPLEYLLLDPPWYLGRVLLIGDAAHATTPHMGYGAGLAVEDAIVLTESLQDDCTLATALDRFMKRRYERCRIVVEGSARLGELEMLQAGPEIHRQTMMDISEVIRQPI